jgi:hypothetical protein
MRNEEYAQDVKTNGEERRRSNGHKHKSHGTTAGRARSLSNSYLNTDFSTIGYFIPSSSMYIGWPIQGNCVL